jgi:predicted membrane-bound mannosyltransferase
MAKNKAVEKKATAWLDRPVIAGLPVTWEVFLFAIILLLAFLTRFYDLGTRVMSHDETSHVYFSWQLFQGNGYSHSALTHGPLQFHLIAFSYFLYGDSDFSARIPMALFSIATIAFTWNFRRYIGRIGALIAATIFLISPYMLYYGRYARNEAFVGLFGVISLWAILRYLDLGEKRYLYFLTAATALHFASKETSFIYVAQALLFLGFLFLLRLSKRVWAKPKFRQYFFIAMGAVVLFAIAGGILFTLSDPSDIAQISATEVAEPAVPGVEGITGFTNALPGNVLALLGAAGLALIAALQFLVRGYGWAALREERSFSLMLLLFTLTLPHLAAFPITWLGGNALDYSTPENLALIITVILVMAVLSAAMGLTWNFREWLINFAIFYAIFIPLFTTIFTNTNGFFSGLVGSLGYWIDQQAVQRGNQPPYYYWGVQIPIYEYLAAFGTVLAGWMGIHKWRTKQKEVAAKNKIASTNLEVFESRQIALVFFVFWTVTSLMAYTIAGEKMPWLTYHIAIPMILLSGWAFGRLINRYDFASFHKKQGWLSIGALIVFFLSLASLAGTLLGSNLPFQGQETLQLQTTYQFIFQLVLFVGSAYWLTYLLTGWSRRQVQLSVGILLMVALASLTTRTSFRAAYIEYDNATEYLVYAHMARGPKEIMERVEELSARIEDGNTMIVAYDNETSYPFWWYLRNFPNQRFYGESPGRDLIDAAVILVGDTNYGKLEPIVRNNYHEYEYIRIWWPNQDYFDFTQSAVGFDFAQETGLSAENMGTFDYLRLVTARIWGYLGDPATREAIFDIWLNRDYEDYFAARGQSIDLTNWNPSRTMRMYVRKDVVAQIWDFGAEPVAEINLTDPYEGKGVELAAAQVVEQVGAGNIQFNSPRGMAMAPDGTLFVADANNHQIVHLAADGSLINSWGVQSDATDPDPALGQFNEPWGIAVSPDGDFVYVADTWNHRIQKFTSAGVPLTSWGIFSQGEELTAFYGPRDVLVDNDGNVLVMDTGNKRISVFDSDGNFISKFGSFGFDLGFFDEPVGLALDRERNLLYVADTWNQRVQVISYSNGIFDPLTSWDISGWFGQSLENKPYLTVGFGGTVFITDPEAGRILAYNPDGEIAYFWGGFDQGAVFIGVAQGIAGSADSNAIWITDSLNNVLLKFEVPLG